MESFEYLNCLIVDVSHGFLLRHTRLGSFYKRKKQRILMNWFNRPNAEAFGEDKNGKDDDVETRPGCDSSTSTDR